MRRWERETLAGKAVKPRAQGLQGVRGGVGTGQGRACARKVAGSAQAARGRAVGAGVVRRLGAGDLSLSEVEVEVWPWRFRALTGECGTCLPLCLLPRFPRGGGRCSWDCPGGRPAGPTLSAGPESVNSTQHPKPPNTLEPSTTLSTPLQNDPQIPLCVIYIILPYTSLSNVRGRHTQCRPSTPFCFSLPGPPSHPFPLQAPLHWRVHPGLPRGGESVLPLKNTKTSTGSESHFSGPRNTQRS